MLVVLLVIVRMLITSNIVQSITIDSQLQVVKNDCYERLAIGQRLSKKDVYRETDSNTIMDCQLECTKDENMCRSFSFGIGIKGNATCELSSYAVKETIDLKPIGTTPDTEYDLYIKKLGCKIILDRKPSPPISAHDDVSTVVSQHIPNYHIKETNAKKKPEQNHELLLYNNRPTSQRHYDQNYGHFGENKPYRVGTLVSVSPGSDEKFNRNPYYHESSESYGSSHTHYEKHSSSYRPHDTTDGYGLFGTKGSYDSQNHFPSKPNTFTQSHDPLQTTFTQHNKHDPITYGGGSSSPHPSDYNQSHFSYAPNVGTNYDRPEVIKNDDIGYIQDTYLLDRPSRFPYDQSLNKPHKRPLDETYNKPLQDSAPPFRPSYFTRPYDNSNRPTTSGSYYTGRPNDPDDPNSGLSDRYDSYPNKPEHGVNSIPDTRPFYGSEKPDLDETEKRPNGEFNKSPTIYSPQYPHQKPIISERIGPNGQLITSIITEIPNNACFRRALPGKRAVRALVRRAVSCERVEECQQECADEKHFVCEGFNYRLDSSGRGQGDCELLNIPYVRLDIRRDIIIDPDYDYYHKERNNYPDCKSQRPASYRPDGGGTYTPRERPSYYGIQHPKVGPSSYGSRFPVSSYDGYGDPDYSKDKNRFDGQYDYRTQERRVDDDRYGVRTQPYNRRGDYFDESYHSQESYEDHFSYKFSNKHDHQHKYFGGYHYPKDSKPDYIHKQPYEYKSYEPYLPSYDRLHAYDRDRDDKNYANRNHWGFDDKRWGLYGGTYGDFGSPDLQYGHQNYYNQDHNINDDQFYGRNYNYLPQTTAEDKGWGKYGGNYGTGGNTIDNYIKNYNFWGLNRSSQNKFDGYDRRKFIDISPVRNRNDQPYLPISRGHTGVKNYPDEGYHYNPSNYIFLKDECSLRSATGFRLYKGIVKKIQCVPNIYECEMLCFKEKDFLCTSYAFRYTIGPDVLVDNCYLSDKNYKELDYYTDLEQDHNFDIYTMNNKARCDDVKDHGRDFSECFWHIRSGQRLEDRCVKTSINVPSVVECQIECLKSPNFICRAFAFRYGSPIIGGPLNNCQLTDLPFYELELTSEPGFEIYERGSFGHGCEIIHFAIREQSKPGQTLNLDEICYVEYSKPAAILREATDRALLVKNELECKRECTRAREQTPLHCMSFSYRSAGTKDEPNCCLSSIFQRDLTENVDYINDPNSWLFAWDHYNPLCQNIESKGAGGFAGLDTWKLYSVGGWPCRRGTSCKQNKEVGFWFCELEGESPSSWDYCCRPDHQCGYSEGYPYQWCYVGPSSTQWRKCSDKYYPYTHNILPINDDIRPHPTSVSIKPYLPNIRPHPDFNIKPNYLPNQSIKTSGYREPRPWITTDRPITNLIGLEPPYRPSFRPDRPNATPPFIQEKPSLNEYEAEFDNQFLDPPRPGGFGPPRHWPVSYLHKEMPPNVTTPIEQKYERMEMSKSNQHSPKLKAIQNLIDIIKSNDLKNVQYQITNNSNKADDVLYVQIPLPLNFSNNVNTNNINTLIKLDQPVDLLPPKKTMLDKNTQDRIDPSTAQNTAKESNYKIKRTPLYRRSFITRTNITNDGRSLG